jgi:hypothetical protein
LAVDSWQLAVDSWQLSVGSWQLTVPITNYQLSIPSATLGPFPPLRCAHSLRCAAPITHYQFPITFQTNKQRKI